MLFSTVNDAHQRLRRSVLPIQGAWVYVKEVGYADDADDETEISIVTESLVGRNRDRLNITGLSIPHPKVTLGWVNMKNCLVWACRSPYRGVRAGINSNNTYFKTVSHENNTDPPYYEFHDYIFSDGFKNMLDDVYPSVSEAIDNPVGMGFSKNFAVKPVSLLSSHVLFRGLEAGEVEMTKKVFILYPRFSYLKESLERVFKEKEEHYEIRCA